MPKPRCPRIHALPPAHLVVVQEAADGHVGERKAPRLLRAICGTLVAIIEELHDLRREQAGS